MTTDVTPELLDRLEQLATDAKPLPMSRVGKKGAYVALHRELSEDTILALVAEIRRLREREAWRAGQSEHR